WAPSASPVSVCSSRSWETTRPGSRGMAREYKVSVGVSPLLCRETPRHRFSHRRSCGTEYAVLVDLLKRLAIFVAVLVVLCAFYTGYRQLYLSTGWTPPFKVHQYSL